MRKCSPETPKRDLESRTERDQKGMAMSIWHESWTEAQAQAEATGRLRLRYFHAPG